MFKGSFRLKVLGVIVLLGLNAPALAESSRPFDNRYLTDPERPRNPVWPPLISLVIPGFDQWWEGQYAPAATYSGYALSGLSMAAHAKEKMVGSPDLDLDSRDNRNRQYLLGSQMYMFAGELSAYHSFRSTAATHPGLYDFLRSDETTMDLVTAPFDFTYLARPTTFIPLGLLLGFVVADLDHDSHAGKYIDGSDIGYGSAFSYQAGVGEEALFRGYMMPTFRARWGSDFWANVSTAVVFGAAHITDDNPVPIAQALAGYYFGYLTIKNNWSLREAIFVHTWWDIIVFTGGYLSQSNAERSIFLPLHLAYF